MNILLMGNPNVGKSVVFSRLTGVHVISSNYPGTTVSFSKGFMKVGNVQSEVTDVPGTYTLEPTCEAEEIAAKMVDSGDVIINVLSAINLERNLYLTLQLLETGIPVIVCLNMWDETKHRGISIDIEELEKRLGVPVIPTSALTGQGIKELVERIPQASTPNLKHLNRDERWSLIGEIVEPVQNITHRHHRWFERLEDASVKPISGIPMGIFVLAVSFFIIRFIGENIITHITDPVFLNLWKPLLMKLSTAIRGNDLFHDVLIGKLIGGDIHMVESFGILSSGLYVPIGMVLPYIISFYLVLGLLEDTGYLPRLSVLVDTAMHKIGLHGYAIVPTLLGFGCNVPAILATRVLESERQRFIAATLVAIAIPCASAQAMIFGLLGRFGAHYVLMVYGILFVIWITLGIILNKILKGMSPELLLEIPPYRIPPWRLILGKLYMRGHGFLVEAVPIILAAVFMINILFYFGIFDYAAELCAPLVTGVLGLPKESVTALVIGFLRKDAALGMLAVTTMTPKHLVIGTVVLTMFFPCIATFVVLLKELGLKNTTKSIMIMLLSSILVGGVLNAVL